METDQENEHEKHQRMRVQLEALRVTMQRNRSYEELSMPNDQLVLDPMIYPGLYSPSGFNIMDILIAIRRRPKPTFSIGAIDGSVSLLLCDMASPDLPIVHCTETFQKLVGYPESEILGRNCRFLQYPPPGYTEQTGPTTGFDIGQTKTEDSTATAGDASKEINPSAVIHSHAIMQNDSGRMTITECIANSVEGQASFINYRQNGERFWNLLTIIPIENGGRKYFVGLQADLGPVESTEEMKVAKQS